MTYKSIVLVATGDREDKVCLTAAARLASRCGAQIRVIPAFADPAAEPVYYGMALGRAAERGAAERIQSAESGAQDALEALARDVAAAEGLTYGIDSAGIVVEKRDLMPPVAIAEAAIASDLMIFGGRAVREAAGAGAVFAETLLSARAPVLLIKGSELSLKSAAIAWDGSAQAGRAVRAALPLLAQVEDIVVLQNVDDLDWNEHGRVRAERLLAHLQRHGMTRVRSVNVEGDDVAQSLIAGARREACDVLVSGAYGRPRLYELVLGGTTRSLVRSEDGVHVFLAH